MSRVEVIEKGVLYRNPLPGHRAVIAFAPFVLPLSKDELICTFRHGQAMYSHDGMVYSLKSEDGGRTWGSAEPVRDREKDSMHYDYRSGLLTALRDGSIVMMCNRAGYTDPDRLYINPDTGGHTECEIIYVRSRDGGSTWTEPVIAELPEMPRGFVPAADGPIVELDDGRWMQLCSTWKSYDNAGAHNLNSFVLFSDDEGKSWGGWVDVANGLKDDRSYSHGHIIRLRDGRFFCVFWAGNAQLTEFYDLCTVTSDDLGGQRWGRPVSTGIPGQSSYPASMEDGRCILVYSHRENTDQPGIKLIVSDDEGKTWDSDDPFVAWDAYGKESLGVPRSSNYPSSHDAIAYGAPHVAHIDDDMALVSFWCTQSGDTNCRFCLLRIR